MREGIHPNYVLCNVNCACGHTFQTRSTVPKMHLEICSKCHPYYTGKQKLVDSAGRVERFTRRFEKTGGKTLRVKAKAKAAKPVLTKNVRKILSTGATKEKTEKTEKAPKKTASSK